MGSKNFHLFSLIALAAVVFVLYANSLNNEFVYDDHLLVVKNYYLRSWNHLGRIFTGTLFAGAGHPSAFYRPLQVFSLLLDYSLWKLSPPGYHLTNIILHFLAAAGVYFLACRLLVGRRKSALAAALLFAAHPVHTEAVTYVAGRSDPLASVFALSSLLAFISAFAGDRRRWQRNLFYSASLFGFLLALLSRETMLVLPFALVLYRAAVPGKGRAAGRGKELMRVVPYFFVAAGYLLWRKFVLAGFKPAPSLLSATPLVLRLVTTAKTVFLYLGILLWPLGLHMERSLPLAGSFWEPSFVLSALGVMVICALALLLRRRSPVFFFAVFWFFLFLLPTSNIVPLNANMAEHWLYLPSAGIFLLLAAAAGRLFELRNRAGKSRLFRYGSLFGLILLFGFYASITVKQNGYWKDDITFYSRTLAYTPVNSRILANLGGAYAREGRHKEAVAEYRKALEIRPNEASYHSNLGGSYRELGDYRAAMSTFRRALELNPDHADARINLGGMYLLEGKLVEAGREFERALKINPFSASAHYNLGAVYARLNRLEEAAREYRRTLEIDPDYIGARTALGDFYLGQGRPGQARAEYERLKEADPGTYYHRLGVLSYNQRNYREAVIWLYQALEADPEKAGPRTLLGNIRFLQGSIEQAESEYRKALEINPADAEALNGLGYLYVEEGINLEEGTTLLEKAVAMKPDNPAYLDSLGWAYYKQEKIEEALAKLEKAAELDKDNPHIREHLEIARGRRK